MLKLLSATAVALALSMSGAAFADMPNKSSQGPTTRTERYKESQPQPHAEPGARSVEPDSELRRPGLYREAPQQALTPRGPKPQSVMPKAELRQQLYGIE
jgi:hypothetical protein